MHTFSLKIPVPSHFYFPCLLCWARLLRWWFPLVLFIFTHLMSLGVFTAHYSIKTHLAKVTCDLIAKSVDKIFEMFCLGIFRTLGTVSHFYLITSWLVWLRRPYSLLFLFLFLWSYSLKLLHRTLSSALQGESLTALSSPISHHALPFTSPSNDVSCV